MSIGRNELLENQTESGELSKESLEFIQEYVRCKKDPFYFIEKYCRDYTVPDLPPIKLYPIQRKMIEAVLRNHRVIILGSRQVGKTLCIVLLISWLVLFHPNYIVAVLSRKQEASNQIVYEVRRCLETLGEPFTVSFEKTSHVEKKLESNIRLANKSVVQSITVRKENPVEAGRGLRANFIFIDEAAFIPALKDVLSGLSHTTNRSFVRCEKAGIPYGLVLSSTPNRMTGVGATFYQYWIGAQNNSNGFTPVKFHWSDVPEFDETWYQTVCKDKSPEEIAQELDLIFLGDKDSFFSDDLLKRIQEYHPETPPKERLIEGQRVHIWCEPQEKGAYIIGVDTATQTGNSLSAICVVDVNTKEQVAEFLGKPSTTVLCKVLEEIVNLYKNCCIVVESNGVGNQVVEYCLENDTLKRRLFYTLVRKQQTWEKKYGLVNEKVTRQQLLSCVYDIVSESLESIKSPKLLSQLLTLRNRGGKIVGDPDDAVFAFAFTLWALKYHTQRVFSILGTATKTEGTRELDIVNKLFDMRYSQRTFLGDDLWQK